MVPGSQPAPPRLMPRCLAVPQSNTVAEVPWGVLIRGWGAGPALGAHRPSGTDPRNSQRARRVALACEVVSEDHITRSKTARGAIARATATEIARRQSRSAPLDSERWTKTAASPAFSTGSVISPCSRDYGCLTERLAHIPRRKQIEFGGDARNGCGELSPISM